jgi:CRISPR-associated exonuclease Cas4
MTEQQPHTLRVIDLKQYIYCPRILYYHTVLPEIRPITYKMEAGIQAHIAAESREKRRKLRTYGLQTGQRTFNLPLHSAELGLSGIIDMVIETETERIPVDYKQAKKIGNHFKLQLMAYGRLLETQDNPKPVKRGFLYLLPSRQAIEIKFTPHLRRSFQQALQEIKTITLTQQMPAPTPHTGRCLDCEFRRFCNDTL